MQQDNENGSKLERAILAPYTHLLQVKGKQLRTKIALSFNHWLRLPEEKLHQIVDTVAMLHVGTLLFDDVQDNASLRRGIPAAHRVFGTPLTINASVHVVFMVLKKFLDLHPKAAEIYADDFLEALRGQGADLYWRDNFLCPTEDEHMRIVEQKTGRMFSIPVRVGQLFSDYKTDLSELALLLGRYFQIRDDYCNLTQQEELEEWPGEEDKQADTQSSFCDDLTEGKFSLPIIHAMNTPARGQILDILRQRTEDVELKKNCVSLLEKAGSLQYTRHVLENLERRARAEIARLGGNPKMEACMDELLTWKQ